MDTLCCPNCEADVPESAATCPGCGEPMGHTVFDLGPPPDPGVRRGPAPATPQPKREVYARFLTSTTLKEPIELEAGEAFRIGRSRQADVCFPSSHVSRFHTEVLQEQGRWVVGDMGSKNGTYVNGERIYRQTLRHGDTISVGHFELVYRELTRAETFELLRQQTDVSKHDTAPIHRDEDGLFGNLAKLSIVEVVQLIHQARKTGYLQIESVRAGGSETLLHFLEGDLVHAEADKRVGEPVATRALRLRTGRFCFNPTSVEAVPPPTIRTPTSSLLLSAAAAPSPSGASPAP